MDERNYKDFQAMPRNFGGGLISGPMPPLPVGQAVHLGAAGGINQRTTEPPIITALSTQKGLLNRLDCAITMLNERTISIRAVATMSPEGPMNRNSGGASSFAAALDENNHHLSNLCDAIDVLLSTLEV